MKRILVASGTAGIVLGAAFLGATSAAPAARAGGPAKKGEERDLVVTLVTPTLNQEVAADFTDPGLGKVITVRFSSSLRRGDIISASNVFNRLTPKVELTDAKFLRLPGNPTVSGSVFRFDPLSVTPTGSLPAGQYTLTMKSSIRNTTGHLLNSGLRDFVTTFSVGTDVYLPVLRKASPIHNQINIGLNQRIVLTFNEPIDATSVGSTITVQNVSVNPPSTILGQGGTGITLERNGFDVVFTPDPCFGYPPLSAIQMTVQGKPATGPSPATVTDEFQNPFGRDPGLQWTFNANTGNWESPNGVFTDSSGVFRLTFTTKGIVPPPVLIAPGSPNFFDPAPPTYSQPCYGSCVYLTPSCRALGSGMYYTTGNGIGQVDLRPFFQRQVQNAGNTLYDPLLYNLIANAPVRTGRPTGIMVDPRWDLAAGPSKFHTFLYVADGRSKTVQVLDSRNFKRLGFFGGFTEPSDVAISNTLQNDRTTLLVSDRAASNVTMVDLQTFTVTLSGQPAAPGETAPPSPCEALKETLENRIIIPVGAGPTTVNADGFLQSKAISTNSLDNSVTIIDIKQGTALQTAKTGSNPVEADFSYFGFGVVDVGVIANQGGLVDPDGSVSIYFRAPRLQNIYQALAQTHDGIEATFTDGIKNPTAVWAVQQWIACSGNSIPTQSYYVSNTGSDTVMDLNLLIQGIFGLNITVSPRFTHTVGLNPTSAMYDGFNPAIPSLWIAVGGEGRFAGMDPNRSIKPRGRFVPGIRRLYTCFSH